MKINEEISIEAAYPHKDELAKLWAKCVLDPKYKDAGTNGYSDLCMDIKSDDWSRKQIVAIVGGKIVGFLAADISRATCHISQLYAINFTNNAEGFTECMAFLFKRWLKEFTSIVWTVVVGSRTERVYNKICKEFGGTIIGITKRTGINLSQEICDIKKYQVMGKKKIK